MPGRKPFLDNTRLLLAGILALVVVLAGLLALATRTSAFAPDVLAEAVLYALSATNLTILLALLFVLARNIIKLVVEQRRAIPFARFRTRLVVRLFEGMQWRDFVNLVAFAVVVSSLIFLMAAYGMAPEGLCEAAGFLLARFHAAPAGRTGITE